MKRMTEEQLRPSEEESQHHYYVSDQTTLWNFQDGHNGMSKVTATVGGAENDVMISTLLNPKCIKKRGYRKSSMRSTTTTTLLSLAIICVICCDAFAFHHTTVPSRNVVLRRNNVPPSSVVVVPRMLCSKSAFTTCTTHLHAFLWFGGDEEEEDKDGATSSADNEEKVAASLKNVATILEKMQSFKASQRVGEKSQALLQELQDKETVEGTAANGKVKVVCNGQQQPLSVSIDDGYLQELVKDEEASASGELSSAVLVAMAEAHTKSSAKLNEKLKSLYADLGFDN